MAISANRRVLDLGSMARASRVSGPRIPYIYIYIYIYIYRRYAPYRVTPGTFHGGRSPTPAWDTTLFMRYVSISYHLSASCTRAH